MWKMVSTNEEMLNFMDKVCYFHDSCIKEISYLSGAYVSDDLSMFPLNDRRVLRVVIQRQSDTESMIEMEFQGLQKLILCPVDERYTCEILDSAMTIRDGRIYWCDCNDLSKPDLDKYTGAFICASKLRWRSIENHMGKKEFYRSDV